MRDPHEQWCMDNAEHYTTCIFRGRGQYDVQEHKTLEGAREAAKKLLPSTLRGVAIYAVSGIHQGHVENVMHPTRGEKR